MASGTSTEWAGSRTGCRHSVLRRVSRGPLGSWYLDAGGPCDLTEGFRHTGVLRCDGCATARGAAELASISHRDLGAVARAERATQGPSDQPRDDQKAAQPASPVSGQQGNPAPIITPPPANFELLALLQNYGGLIIGALNRGMPGYDFAASVIDLTGTATHAMVVGHGGDALLQAMLSIPEIAMFGEARVKRFIDEFINCDRYLEATNEEEEAAEVKA